MLAVDLLLVVGGWSCVVCWFVVVNCWLLCAGYSLLVGCLLFIMLNLLHIGC